VTQIYSCNGSARLGELDYLVAMYPHLYKQGCYAHILDLLLEYWGKEEMHGDPNNKGQADVYLHPKPPCVNGIVSPLFTEAIIESTTRDKVCMQLPHDCSHA
jgi:hypothetical protein